MKLIISGILETISTRSDGTIKFSFGTQEIDASDAGNLFNLRGKYIKCLLSDSNISAIEEKIIDEETVKDGRKIKSQAQRIRATLYRLWEQTGKQTDFDNYYKEKTELIIEHFKSKLE